MTSLIKKEMREIFKTYRLWVIPVFFLFLGFSAPAAAKFLPDLLASQIEAQNLKITFPEPSVLEAFQSYFKNLAQMGLIAVILFSMGLVSEERSSGVLAQVVTKPVGRGTVVWSKWLVHAGWFAISMAAGAVGAYLYTWALFEQPSLGGFVFGNLIFAVYMLFVFSSALAASAVFKRQIGAGATAFLIYFAAGALTLFPDKYARFTPGFLSGAAVEALSKPSGLSDVVPAMISAAVLSIVLVAGAIAVFQRQEL